MADIDSALMKQVFDISQRERKADIHHHRKANNFGRCLEMSEGIRHPKRLPARIPVLKALSSDSAVEPAHRLEREWRTGQDEDEYGWLLSL